MRRRRKKSRTTLRLGPIVWLLLIVNTWVGFARSPITVIRHVKFEGAQEKDRLRFAEAAQSLKGIPCAQINPLEFQSIVTQDPAVKSVELSRSIFGTARAKLTYRKVVAKLSTNPQAGVGDDGSLFVTGEDTTALPTLKLPVGMVQISMGMMGTWDCVRIAGLCISAKKDWPKNSLEVELRDDGHLCLNIDSGRVVLGSTDDLDEKLGIVRDRLSRNPRELDEIQELVLTNPAHPTIVRKRGDRGL